MVLCLVCDGSGWRRRQAGDVVWDAYVVLPVEEAIALPVMPTPTRSLEPAIDAFAWERSRAAHDRHGSYAELRRALDWLRDRQPRRYTLVRAVLVDHEPRTLSAFDSIAVDLGVLALALRMRTVRVPPWLMERDNAERRRQTVEALAAEGRTAGEIARVLGLTKEAVRRRLKGVESRHAGIPARAM